eukprot:scaffold1123_cov347-Prasinococcus_capsulatus_cf.AAC.5
MQGRTTPPARTRARQQARRAAACAAVAAAATQWRWCSARCGVEEGGAVEHGGAAEHDAHAAQPRGHAAAAAAAAAAALVAVEGLHRLGLLVRAAAHDEHDHVVHALLGGVGVERGAQEGVVRRAQLAPRRLLHDAAEQRLVLRVHVVHALEPLGHRARARQEGLVAKEVPCPARRPTALLRPACARATARASVGSGAVARRMRGAAAGVAPVRWRVPPYCSSALMSAMRSRRLPPSADTECVSLSRSMMFWSANSIARRTLSVIVTCGDDDVRRQGRNTTQPEQLATPAALEHVGSTERTAGLSSKAMTPSYAADWPSVQASSCSCCETFMSWRCVMSLLISL